MPTVHPQVKKARDLMPLIAAASDENDEIRELTKPVVKAPGQWRVLHHAEDRIRWRHGAGKPSIFNLG